MTPEKLLYWTYINTETQRDGKCIALNKYLAEVSGSHIRDRFKQNKQAEKTRVYTCKSDERYQDKTDIAERNIHRYPYPLTDGYPYPLTDGR